MFQLTAKTGAFKGASWTIGESPLVLGRDILCDITIDDPLVSRRHCEVKFVDGAVSVEDLGSSNATFVNARPVRQAKLGVGDEMAVGGVIFFVTMLRGNAPAASPRHRPGADTHSIKIGEPTYLDEDASSLFAQGRPRTAEELAALFELSRALSQTNGTAQAVAHLLEDAGKRFEPEGTVGGAVPRRGGALAGFPFRGCGGGDGEPSAARDRVEGDSQAARHPAARALGEGRARGRPHDDGGPGDSGQGARGRAGGAGGHAQAHVRRERPRVSAGAGARGRAVSQGGRAPRTSRTREPAPAGRRRAGHADSGGEPGHRARAFAGPGLRALGPQRACPRRDRHGQGTGRAADT